MSLQHNAFQQDAFQVGIFGASGTTPPPPVTPTETPAGKRTRFQRYILRVDGQEIACRDLHDVYNKLEKAKALARKLAQTKVREATEPKAKVKPLALPKISGSTREMHPIVQEAQAKIREIYKSANMDMEIALWFAREREIEDDDTATLLFWM